MIKACVHGVLLICLALFLPLSLTAYMVHSLPTTVYQPDGSKLECFASGDEYHNWLHDKDNYTIIRNPATGYYCYAAKTGTQLVSSQAIAGRIAPQSLNINPGLNISTEEYRQKRQTMFWAPPERDAPTTGTINNIVIFIRFSGESEFGQNISVYDGWFNSSTNSQKNYFLEASYNQLTVNTNFYPAPSNNLVVSWQDSHPRAYYQPYDASTNPTGYDGDTQRRTREFTLLQNATAGVASQIPSSLTIDSDGDGRVDNVVFLVKGSAGAWSSLLWPHRWSLYDRYVYINGKRVYDFNFQLQTFLAGRGVGVICHEFFHTLGAPDLYHYTDNGISTAGSWDIMESDQNPPQHMTAFMKYKYGDWISSIPTISADGVYSLNPLTSPTGNAYRINSNNANQYYVVEFRKKTGTYESSIPGSGMLIYRIDTSCGDGNADGPPDELYIYRPGGTTTVNGTISSAYYSSESGRIKIDNTTSPTPFLQDGSAGNLYLCEIGSSAGTTMSFRKGTPYVDFSVNPYTQSFDATTFPPDGWTNQVVNGTYLFERATAGTNPTCTPQSGAGMLRYNSDVATSGYSAMLATPRMVCSDLGNYGFRVSFWMFRDGNFISQQDKLEIYMNTSADLSGSPVLVGSVFRNRNLAPVESIPGWHQYSFTLPVSAAGSYYAVLKAISAGGYNIFLDNIQLTKFLLPPSAAVNPTPADAATGINFYQALSWQAGTGSPTSYKLYLGTDNPPTNVINGQNLGLVTSCAPTADLLLGTQYYWKIVPVNAGGDATNCPVWTFATQMDTSVFPLEENFGVSGTAFPPTNWTRYAGVLAEPSVLTVNTSYWVQDDWLNVTTPVNKCARMNIYSTNRYGWMITPLLHIPAGAMLRFDLGLTDYANSNPISSDPAGTTGSDDQFAVLIGNGVSWTSANLLRKWDNAGSSYVYNNISATGETVYLDLSAYQGYKYIAFYGASSLTNADNDLFVDNVSVVNIPATPVLVCNTSVWDAGISLLNNSSSKQIKLCNGGAGILSISSISVSGSPAFTLSGLPSMPLSLGLGQSCSFTVQFNPATAGTHTAAISIGDNRQTTQIQLTGTGYDPRIFSLPQTEDFDSVITPNLPLGWTSVVSSTSTSAYVRSTTTNPVSYPNSVYLTNYTDTAADLRLVSPEVMVPMHVIRLRFHARGSAADFPLQIGTMNSPTGTFTLLQTLTLSATDAEYLVPLSFYLGADTYIAFKHGLGGTSRSIYIDNIMLEELLSNDLMVSGMQCSGLGIAGTPLSCTVQVKNNGLITQTGYTVQLASSATREVLASLLVSDPLSPEATAMHSLSFTPSGAAVFDIIASVILPTDSYTGNNSSDPQPTHIYPSDTVVPFVGDELNNTTGNLLPLDFYYKNSLSETIYLASDIQLTAGTIQAVVYYNNFVQDLPTQAVKIWMKNTTATDLSSNWLDFAGYTLVFDGLVDFPSGTNVILIPLATGFNYTGGNLAVRVNRPMDSVYYNMYNHFYCFTDALHLNSSLYLYNDNTTYDPTAPSASGTLSNYVPLTTFVIGNYVPLTLDTPQVAITSLSGDLTLSWNSVQGAMGYQVFCTDDPGNWPDTPLQDVSGTTFSVSLSQARQFYRVKAYYQPRRLSNPDFTPMAVPRKPIPAMDLQPQTRNKD